MKSASLSQQYSCKYGENLMVEYNWGYHFHENIVYFYYQLIRSKNLLSLESKLYTLLAYTILYKDKSYQEELIILYKMIGHTRDIRYGRGEYALAYMQIWVWYHYYPELALFAFRQFVQGQKYGSWKDIKYFCEYILQKTADPHHPCIEYACSLITTQLQADYKHFQKGEKISYAAKWAPREKSKYHWVNKKIAFRAFPHFFTTCKTLVSMKKAECKAKIHLRKMLSNMNRSLQTPQIYMCENKWSQINFEKVSLQTIHKNRRAFQNKNKTKHSKSNDRYICTGKFQDYISTLHITSPGQLGKLVQSAFQTPSIEDSRILNILWGHTNTTLENIISIVDVSSSLEEDNSQPLYNAIGLGVRAAEMTKGSFHNCVLVFSATPTWFHFTPEDTFVDKITQIKNCLWGLNSNLEAALKLLVESMVASKIDPALVSQLTLCIFSDMQTDPFVSHSSMPLYKNIKKIFKKVEFAMPHIKFWNVRQTDGFPVLGRSKSNTLLSGSNEPLLNILCKRPKRSQKPSVIPSLTPLYAILNKSRYRILENKIISKIK